MHQLIRSFIIMLAGWAFQAETLAQPPTTVRALFLGNSYVTANNLPLLIKQAATSAGDTLIYAENCPGGYTFSDHLNNPVSQARMAEPQWDYVIIQQQSILGSSVCNEPYNIAPNNFEPNNVQSVSDLKGQIDVEGGIPMLYMTWGRKNGEASLCAQFPQAGYYCTFQGMDSLLQQNYRQMAGPNLYFNERLPLTAVGAVWRFVRTNHPEIELYSSDGSHPSLAGSYLAACTFYNMLFRKSAQDISFNPGLPVDAAAKIRMAVHTVVNNKLQSWNVGYYDPAPDFIIEGIEPAIRTVLFKNESNKLSLFANYYYQNFKRYKYRWSFGDGSFSDEVSPVHTFNAPGVYTVKLYAAYKNGSFLDSVSRVVRIGGPLISLRAIGADEREKPLTNNDSLLFSSVLVGDTLSRTFHVYNHGTVPLTINQVLLSVNNGWSYAVDSATVNPGGNALLTIRFHPLADGQATSLISLITNDSYTGTFNLKLSGNGIGLKRTYEVYRSRIVLPNESKIDFGRPALAQEIETMLEMKNTGNCPLKIQAIYLTGDTDAFYVAARPQLLNPNNSISLPLICRVSDTQSRTAYLHIATDNPDLPVYRAKLTAYEKKSAEEMVSIYPNPIANVLNVTLRNNRIAGFSLFDMNGKILANKRVTPTYLLTIQPPALSSGIYIIQVRSEDGKIYAGKIVKLND